MVLETAMQDQGIIRLQFLEVGALDHVYFSYVFRDMVNILAAAEKLVTWMAGSNGYRRCGQIGKVWMYANS